MVALKDVKKMCSKFCNGKSSDIVGYTPPTLHKGVRWFVDFTALDPARGLMRRKRYYIKDSLSISGKDSKKCVEPDISEDSAILFFTLEEKFPIGCVMDMLDDDMEMLLLYHGISKADPKNHHCCFFASPKFGQSMYKVNMVTQPNGFVEGISVTIYDSIDIWEDELESDLLAHEAAFDFIEAMTATKLLSVFCKMSYDC